MKKILYCLFSVLIMMQIYACNKNEIQDKTSKLTTENFQIANPSIIKAELHRVNGTSKKIGLPCNCVHCFGLCDITILGHKLSSSIDFNLLAEPLNNGIQVKLYIFETPNEDVEIDPKFYIDHNVEYYEDNNLIYTIKEGEYEFIEESSSYTFPNGNTYNYSGYVIVDLL